MEDAALVTEHELALTGLTPDTLYDYTATRELWPEAATTFSICSFEWSRDAGESMGDR